MWPALIAAGGSLLGGILGNSANARQAEMNRDWQEYMSNTQYQRGTKDMIAAGINPMLAYMKGGASPGTGAQAQQQDVITPAINSALQARANKAQVELLEAQAGKAKAEMTTEWARTTNVEADTNLKRGQFGVTQENIRQINADISRLEAVTGLTKQQTQTEVHNTAGALERVQQIIQQTKLFTAQQTAAIQQAYNYMKQGDLAHANRILAELEQPGAQATARFFEQTGEASKYLEAVRLIATIFRAFAR